MISKERLFKFFIASMCAVSQLPAATPSLSLFDQRAPTRVEINNRLLAVVNGKPITVYDLVKKMDMTFYQRFPEYASSVEARYQYYTVNWRNNLADMIDKELILADAEQMKITISHGEIRQEIETLFGPNVIENLDKIGMSYDEAHKIIEGDLLLKRMMGVRVHVKAMRFVTPQAIKKEYEEYAKKNIIPGEWTYNVVSIRENNPTRSATIAHNVHRLLTEENVPLNHLKAKLAELGLGEDAGKVSISEPLQHKEKDLSDQYLKILSGLKAGQYSAPVEQKSRASKSSIYRIFYLKDVKESAAAPFAELENRIRGKLINEVIERESAEYITRLRDHFHVSDEQINENIPENYEPFVLR